MREVSERLQLSARVDGAHLGGLRDRDHARLYVMLDAYAVQQWLDLLGAELAVRCWNRNQLAAGELFRSTAFINVHVRRVSTEDRVIRFCDRLQAKNIRAGAAEDKVHRDVAEVFLKQLQRTRRDRIAAIRDHVAFIRALDSVDYLRMHAGVVVAREAPFTHTNPYKIRVIRVSNRARSHAPHLRRANPLSR